MSDVIFENKKRAEVLKKYLYGNNLQESEVDFRLKEFLEYGYMNGINHGVIIEKNTKRRIDKAIRRKRDKIFQRLIDGLEDDMFNKK